MEEKISIEGLGTIYKTIDYDGWWVPPLGILGYLIGLVLLMLLTITYTQEVHLGKQRLALMARSGILKIHTLPETNVALKIGPNCHRKEIHLNQSSIFRCEHVILSVSGRVNHGKSSNKNQPLSLGFTELPGMFTWLPSTETPVIPAATKSSWLIDDSGSTFDSPFVGWFFRLFWTNQIIPSSSGVMKTMTPTSKLHVYYDFRPKSLQKLRYVCHFHLISTPKKTW